MVRLTRLLALLLAAWYFPSQPVQAQVELGELVPTQASTGQLTSGQEHVWIFTGAEGQVISLVARTTAGDLDVAISLADSDGVNILNHDDLAYPLDTNALIEAVTLSRADTYRVTVRSMRATTGSYELLLLPGYSQLETRETFDAPVDWRDLRFGDGAERVLTAEGSLELAIQGPGSTLIAWPDEAALSGDFYVETDVRVRGVDGWIVGLTARQTDERSFYLLQVNDRGLWRLSARIDGTDRLLRDWTSHPALVPGADNFRLGLLAYGGGGLDFFYDGLFFGRFVDTALANGSVGLSAAAVSALTAQTTATFDNLIITRPALQNNARLVPQQILISTPANMVRDLQRRGLIPAVGDISLTVPESFVESQQPGVEAFLLGRGATARQFVVASRLEWQSAAERTTGCGLIMRYAGPTEYLLAFIDQQRGYGLSQRGSAGFAPGIFGETDTSSSAQRHLLVVVSGSRLLLFVDGITRGSLTADPLTGGFGSAVVNYDSGRTVCEFSDTWAYIWE